MGRVKNNTNSLFRGAFLNAQGRQTASQSQSQKHETLKKK